MTKDPTPSSGRPSSGRSAVRPSSPAPYGRFDDLQTSSGRLFPTPEQILVAERPHEVIGVLSAVERATQAGWWAFGYVGYEAAAGLGDNLTVHEQTPFDMPLAWFGICREPVAVPVVTAGRDPATPPEVQTSWAPAWTRDDHARRVAAVRERIAAGDTYQCNLTERMQAHVSGEPYALYRDLAVGQRAAYSAYLDLGRWVVASASPELFFERRGDQILLRPMKGTASRGRFPEEDQRLAGQLRSSEKERAENLMIVDLVRNDVARVAEAGTVAVPALFTVERYETVLQLTSDVTARLRPGTGLSDLFSALFPCGSVTGAPKVSSMEIIHTLETTPRGVYTGAIGYVAPPEIPVRARFSVAIRTALIDRTTGQAVYGTGGGITWDSDSATEHAELVAKTAVLSCRPSPFTLMETMRYTPGSGLRNLDRHLHRLAASAEHLGFVCDMGAVSAALTARVAGSAAARVRLRLARDGQVWVQVFPLLPNPAGPVRLALDHDPVDPADWRLYHKTSRREPYDLRRQRHADVDDVILINSHGELTETTRANLAVRIAGSWWTPPLQSGCLPGVERARLLDAGVLCERVLRPADLAAAQGIGVLSSLRGWRTATLMTNGATWASEATL